MALFLCRFCTSEKKKYSRNHLFLQCNKHILKDLLIPKTENISSSPGFTQYFLSGVRLRNTSELWLNWIKVYFHSRLCSFMQRAHPQLLNNLRQKQSVNNLREQHLLQVAPRSQHGWSCSSHGSESSHFIFWVFATISLTGESPKISSGKCNDLPTLISPGSGLYAQQILKINPLIDCLLSVVYYSWLFCMHCRMPAEFYQPI